MPGGKGKGSDQKGDRDVCRCGRSTLSWNDKVEWDGKVVNGMPFFVRGCVGASLNCHNQLKIIVVGFDGGC